MQKIYSQNSYTFWYKVFRYLVFKTTSINKISSFINPIKFDDFNFYTVSPYFENNNRDDISLINPSNNLNQYGNYSLFD